MEAVSLRKVGVALIVVALGAPLAWATPPGPDGTCPDVRWDNGVALCPTADGHYEIIGPDGESLGFTHGSDPLPLADSEDTVSSAASGDVQCVSGFSGSYYVRVIYARAYNDADDYASSVSTIRSLVSGAQQLVNDAALASGSGTASLKVRCVDGLVAVDEAILDTAKASATYSTIFADLEQLGYTDPKVKYWVWYDDTGACSCAGIAHIYYDDSPGVGNYNNGNADTMFAVTFGYNSVRTMLHELSHNLGAVQKSAPHTTGAGHCTDGRDTLCYNDGGPKGGEYTTAACSVEVYDCGRNDYFNISPASGTYLATKWNLGHTNNRYMTIVKNVAPTMTSLGCAPTSAILGDTVVCDFAATDPSDGVAYTVEWGDGTTQRVPATGFVASGTTLNASRAYAYDGSFTVRVTATDDNGTAPLTSPALTSAITIQAPPVMRALSCSPSPSQPDVSVTCSFDASDNSTGVYYEVDWGDGTPKVRVPSSGVVAPGTTRNATHTWSAVGAYTIGVTATDNGSPQLTSSTLTTPLAVDPNAAPVMTSLSCSPNPVQGENPTTCSFAATDQFTNVYYTLDWGDGTPTERVPASGSVAPGATQQASHTYLTAASRTLIVTATDTAATPLTSAPRTTSVTVTAPNVPPVMVAASCTFAGQTTPTTCTFRAADSDTTGVRYNVEWGDGSSSIVPSSSYATAGANFTEQHTYARWGTYLLNVSATDNGSPAKTSGLLQISVNVSSDFTGPEMGIQDPFPRTLYYGCTAQGELLTGDAVYVSRGCVRAVVTDPSGVANVTVSIDGVVVGVDTTAPYVLDFPVPYTKLDARPRVVAYDTIGNARIIDLRVDMIS